VPSRMPPRFSFNTDLTSSVNAPISIIRSPKATPSHPAMCDSWPIHFGWVKNHSFLLCHLFPIMFLIIFLMVFSIPHGFQTIEHMENTLGTTSKTCLYYVPNVFSVCSIVPNPCAWPHVPYVIPMRPSDILTIYPHVFTKMFLMLFS